MTEKKLIHDQMMRATIKVIGKFSHVNKFAISIS
jgi:hypothetical protein